MLNNLTNVLPLNIAIFSKKTKIKLYEQSASVKYNSVMLSRTRQTDNYIEINADTLDNVLEINGIKRVDWIKIDVEGAEFEVLKGAIKTLSYGSISLLIEIHNIGDPTHYDKIIDFLKYHNYEMVFEERYHGSSESHVIFRQDHNRENSTNSRSVRALI
jgi:FkbM family methyltransferase